MKVDSDPEVLQRARWYADTLLWTRVALFLFVFGAHVFIAVCDHRVGETRDGCGYGFVGTDCGFDLRGMLLLRRSAGSTRESDSRCFPTWGHVQAAWTCGFFRAMSTGTWP